MAKLAMSVAASAVLMVFSAAAEGLPSIEDVRVEALVSSHWGQKTDTGYSNTGNPCFNRFTPNNYPCGCVATPIAQLLRYWQYPASVKSGVSRCLVDGVERQLEYGGLEYDYDAMPYVTAGADERQRAAIGRLTFDCAVSLHSMFSSGNTFAFGMVSFVQLREIFGYANAIGYVPAKSSSPSAAMKNAIIANLDAKCPVMITLLASANGMTHQALIDGYGYHGGRLYFHFNLGWCNVRDDDAWYELDRTIDQTSGCYYDLIDGLVYNIFPNRAGDVLSGRVLDKDGKPVSNAAVQASRSGKVIDTAQTDANGIYAFVLAGGTTYKVSCEGRSISVDLPSSVSAKRMISSKKEGDIWQDPFQPALTETGTLGGSSGNDIQLSGNPPDPPDPVESVLGPFNPTTAGKGVYPYCGAVYDASGSPCGTMTVKFTKPAKGTSKITATLNLLDGKSYSIKATSVAVNATGPAKIVGVEIKKLGVLDTLEIGEAGFVAEISATGGAKLSAVTTDLSKGLPQGNYRFSVSGFPEAINGFPVVTDMLPDSTEFSVNAKGKIALAKAATLKYAKIKGSKPTAYELLLDTSKDKTNLPGLKLTYTAKTASIKGSFTVYTDNPEKHKINKVSFTVTGMVIDGKAVGVAVCKKPAITCSIEIEKQ